MNNAFEFRVGVFYINGEAQPWCCTNVTGTNFLEHPKTGGTFQIFSVEVDTPLGSRHTVSVGGRAPRPDEYFTAQPNVMAAKASAEGISVPIGGREFLFNWPGEL